jgi:hypothetical protein
MDVYESRVLEHRFPLCFQQSTGDSAAPEVNVILRVLRDFLVHDYVRDLDPPAGLEHAVDLLHHHHLVGAKVDDAVADYDIDGRILYGQRLGQALAELDIRDSCLSRAAGRFVEHRRRHVDRHNTAALAHLASSDEAVEPGATTDVKDRLAGPQIAHRERITHPGERFDRARRKTVNNPFGVSQHQRERFPRVEVEALLRRLRDLGILVADLAAKRFYVNGGRPYFDRHL